jgi:hypothetical protein
MDFIINVAMKHATDDCLTWPFSRLGKGYGSLTQNNETIYAHRYICELAHGRPPTSEHEAAHSCGKGHEGCINPQHLSWKTPAENQADRLLHGTDGRGSRNQNAKLSEADVRAIREDTRKHYEIAASYNVDRTLIGAIKSRKSWAHLP